MGVGAQADSRRLEVEGARRTLHLSKSSGRILLLARDGAASPKVTSGLINSFESIKSRGITKGGPTTEEGKEVVRWNAARHGIRSLAPVVPAIEMAEDWEAHCEGLLEGLEPEGYLGTVLVERVALLSSHLHRVTRYEKRRPLLPQERLEE